MPAGVFAHPRFDDYALLDSGAGEKLERFGQVVLRRPDPQALWSRASSDHEWSKADLAFVRESDRGGRWTLRGVESRQAAGGNARAGAADAARRGAPGATTSWTVGFGEGRFIVRPTPFKHVGLFPEQAANWVAVQRAAGAFGEGRPHLLNLFGYTGAASILAVQAGYDVTHVDASKTSIAWTRENAAASGLAPDALRIVLDDALAFARREARRNARYQVVLLDPPHHGRGPKGETWQFEEDIAALMETVRTILGERALVMLSTYAIGCSPLTLENLLRDLGSGAIVAGELALPEEIRREPARPLPAGFCARFSRGLDPGIIGAGIIGADILGAGITGPSLTGFGNTGA